MNLQSLLVCSDERTLRLLRNVLGELEIDVEHCPDPTQASNRMVDKPFEALIIDCKDQNDFFLLQSIRPRQQNRRSVTVAIIDRDADLHAAFEKGANFVVYKPISTEKAKSSFRAARALMQRERRRSNRLPVNIPGYFRFENGEGEQATISGLSEGGLSVRFAGQPGKKSGVIAVCFALPDTTTVVEATGTVAWQNPRRHAGIQFASISEASRHALKEWLQERCGEKHDPPIRCTLTALSRGGCFLQSLSAFPVQTRVELLLRAADCSLKTEGKVRFMDPELGMGIQFMSRTPDHRRRLEELIQRIIARPDTVAEVLVEPEGLDWKGTAESSSDHRTHPRQEETQGDPLVKLLAVAATLSREQFLRALEQHELTPTEVKEWAPSSASAQRREPRIAVSRQVQIWAQDSLGESAHQTTSMIDVSHHGARIDRTTLRLKPGDPVHLVSDGRDARFRVIWVGKPGTPEEGQIGLQIID